MKLWSLRYDEIQKNNFPQIIYKGHKVISNDEQVKLSEQIFKVLELTCRDQIKDIRIAISKTDELPFKRIHNLIYPNQDPGLEFQTEYMVEILNIFQIEID